MYVELGGALEGRDTRARCGWAGVVPMRIPMSATHVRMLRAQDEPDRARKS